jgi:hypothetical protein
MSSASADFILCGRRRADSLRSDVDALLQAHYHSSRFIHLSHVLHLMRMVGGRSKREDYDRLWQLFSATHACALFWA